MGKSLNGKELGIGICQRKDGLYQGRFTNRFGKRETLYDKKLNNLRVRLRKAQVDDDNAANPLKNNMTLDEWYDIWIDTFKRNCRNTTIVEYKRIYKSIKQELGWRKLQSLEPVILQKVLNDLKSDNQRKRVKIILGDILDKAMGNDLLIKNPAKHLITQIDNEYPKRRRVLSVQETELFLEYSKECKYYNLFVVALETGMRIGELKALNWDDIDFSKRALWVKRTMCLVRDDHGSYFEMHTPKTFYGNRMIPLTSKCVEALMRQKKLNIPIVKKYKNVKFKNLVFPSRSNNPLYENGIIRAIHITLTKMNEDGIHIEKFSPHTFRHTFATRAIENGMNPKVLQQIMGHSTLQMTMDLYCHVFDEIVFDEMKKMEK